MILALKISVFFQDYQKSLGGSTHSQDGVKCSFLSSTNSLQQRGGAFVNYSQRGGSIHSLPDAALMISNNINLQAIQQQQSQNCGLMAPNEDFLAIETLVAELELNTTVKF